MNSQHRTCCDGKLNKMNSNVSGRRVYVTVENLSDISMDFRFLVESSQ